MMHNGGKCFFTSSAKSEWGSGFSLTVEIQQNFSDSNTDGSFTVANSNSFYMSLGNFPITQGFFSLYYQKMYLFYTHRIASLS